MIYPNLAGEIAKKGITKKSMAEQLGMQYKAFTNRMYGKTPLTFDDAVKIKNMFFPESSIEFLFEKKEV